MLEARLTNTWDRVLDKLGQGGMGVVLKAEHRRMKRLVAVKMIAGAQMKSPDAVKRFYREVEAAAKLNHPNIVQAHDACEHEGVHYLVMEYVEGEDLAHLVKQHGPLPVDKAVDHVVQAARGLEYAHREGVIHRDIKPSNLLLDKKGQIKILDMGLARIEQAVNQPAQGVQRYKDARGQYQVAANCQVVGNKALFRRDSRWIDPTVTPDEEKKAQVVAKIRRLRAHLNAAIAKPALDGPDCGIPSVLKYEPNPARRLPLGRGEVVGRRRLAVRGMGMARPEDIPRTKVHDEILVLQVVRG